MAGDIIDKGDLFGDFDLQGEIKSLESLLLVVTKLHEEIKKLAEQKILDIKNIDPGTIEGLKKLGEEKTKVNEIYKRSKDILSEEERLRARLSQLETDQAKVNADIKNQIAAKNKALKEGATLSSTNATLYEKEKVKLNQLAREYRNLALAQGEQSKEAKKKLAEFQELQKKITDVDHSLGNHTDNVGNYKSALGGLSPAFGTAIAGAETFNKSLLKLIKNPFIAIIAGLTAAVVGLFAAFKSTDEGAVKFDGIMKGISNTFEILRQRAVLLGSAFASLFSGEFSEAGDKFAATFANITVEIKEAFEAGQDYAEMLDKIDDAETAFISQRAENANKIARLDFIARDPSKTTRQRIAALKELLEIARAESEEEESIAIERYNLELELFSKTKGLDKEKIKQAIETSRDTGALSKKFSDEEIKHLEELYAKTRETNTKLFEETKKKNAQLQAFILQLDEEFRKELEVYNKLFDELLKKYKKDADDFIKENERKEKAKEKFYDDLIDLEISNQEKLAEIKNDEVGKENARFQRELEQLERNASDEIKKTKEFQKAKELLELEHQKNLQTIDQKSTEKLIKTAQEAFAVYSDLAKKKQDEKLRALDVELANSEKQEENLRQLANQRVLYANESLAIELQKQKDVELEKQKIAKRQQLLEATTAALQLMGDYAKGGSQQPFEDALKDITSMVAALKNIQFYSEGTTPEGVKGGQPGKDSVLAMLTPKEKVFDTEDSAKIGYDIDNSEAANIVYAYRTGALKHMNSVSEIKEKKAWETNEELLKRVTAVERAIKEKPVSSIDPHALAGFITERITTHWETVRKHYKNSNIFN